MKKNIFWYIFSSVVILLIIIGGIIYFFIPEFIPTIKFGASSEKTKIVADVGNSDFVSVFLTNNQVYFGKISNLNSNYPILKDVYYLRVQTSLVPADTNNTGVKVEDKNKTTPTPPPQEKQELTLVKLGNELHGPIDEIKLNKDQILYVEQLKKDSKVVKAILQYEEKNK